MDLNLDFCLSVKCSSHQGIWPYKGGRDYSCWTCSSLYKILSHWDSVCVEEREISNLVIKLFSGELGQLGSSPCFNEYLMNSTKCNRKDKGDGMYTLWTPHVVNRGREIPLRLLQKQHDWGASASLLEKCISFLNCRWSSLGYSKFLWCSVREMRSPEQLSSYELRYCLEIWFKSLLARRELNWICQLPVTFTHEQAISRKGEAYINMSLYTGKRTIFPMLNSWTVPCSNSQENILTINQYTIWSLRGWLDRNGSPSISPVRWNGIFQQT